MVISILYRVVSLPGHMAEGWLHPQTYQGPYTAKKAPGHMSIDPFVIAQQPECCPHSKKLLYQHAFLSPALDCMCEDKG